MKKVTVFVLCLLVFTASFFVFVTATSSKLEAGATWHATKITLHPGGAWFSCSGSGQSCLVITPDPAD